VVFNPYWNVPRSIALKEILPKLDMDPFFLVHEDMEVVDSSGHVLGSAVSDAEYEGILHGTYRIRQRPGKKNALGELKFVFPNDDAIYMHDTPSKSFFAKERRDLSHGCVRVGNPMALALFALSGNGDWDEVRIKDNIASSTDKHLPLKNDIPVLLIYLTANVDTEGKVVFLQDIYQRDSKLAAALNAK
jgi:murein L,D-transpeptidase YcbB/YkuD